MHTYRLKGTGMEERSERKWKAEEKRVEERGRGGGR